MPITDSLPGTEDQPGARIALEAALASDEHLSHAYLFHGPPGTGKRTAARAFAAALLSRGVPDPPDAERRVLKGVHPDLTWVEPRGAHEILVDDVRRQVVREAVLRPFESSKRVFVIADAERMNEESQNALLKTLEEPSAFAIFVLVSSAPGRLLPTIPSRCQAVRFGPVPSGRIVEVLVAEGVDAQVAAACAHLAGGDVVKARWLAGEGAAQRVEAEAAARAIIAHAGEEASPAWKLAEPWAPLLARAAKRGNAAEAQVKEELERLLETEPKKGRGGITREYELQARRAHRRAHTASLDQSLELVALWFRDLVAVASGGEGEVLNVDRIAELVEDARGRDPWRLVQCVDLCEDTRRRLERNVLEGLALEALFNRLRHLAA
jgi:DNA polymerase-3 subunit delta'